MSSDRRFVVISGLPGSGKTTVARALAPLLGLPILDKVEILEGLLQTGGAGDDERRRRLSRESDAILETAASSSDGAVITSFWHAPGMPSNSGTPTAWLGALPGLVVNLHCDCPAYVSADRFMQRQRHPGHGDRMKTAAEVLASLQALAPASPLGIGEAIVVDTTQALNPATILQDVEAAFARCRVRAADSRGIRAAPRT
jgi:hypothetical protein